MSSNTVSFNTQAKREQVWKALYRKNLQKMPATIAGKLEEMARAERLGHSSMTEAVYTKAERRIDELLNGLQAREFKSKPEILGLDELDSDSLAKKALIHARKLYDLQQVRINAARRESELQESIQNGLAKIPLTQHGQFNALIKAMTAEQIESVESE